MHTAYLQLQLAADTPAKLLCEKNAVNADIIRNQAYAVNNCNQFSIVVSQIDLILKIDMGNSYE